MDMLLAKLWYFFFFGGLVCVWPYINLLYRANGLNDAQIGVLAAVKPWVSAPASFLWSGLADRYSLHKPVLLATFILSTLTRTSTAVAHSFTAFMVLAAAGEFLAAPVGVMADAAVVAGCKQDTDYGKSRLWGAVAWGGLSTFSGWLVSSYGMPSGFAAYLLLSLPCVLCAWRMQFNLGSKQTQQQQKAQQQQQDGTTGSDSAVDVGSRCYKQQQQQQQQQQRDGKEGEHWGAAAGDEESDVEQQPLVQHRDQHSSSSSDLDHLFSHAGSVAQHQQQQQQQQLAVAALAAAEHQGLSSGIGEAVEPQLPVTDAGLQPSSGSSSEAGTAGVDIRVLPDSPAQLLPLTASKQQQQQQQHVELALPEDRHISTADAARAAPHPQSPQQQQQQQQQVQLDFWRSLRLLLRRPEVLIFMCQATAMGFGIGVIGEFLFLFLQEQGGSETLMGLTLTFTCLAEVPVFHYQGTVLRYISVHTMLHIVMWTYGIRLGLYALLPYAHTPWAVLPVELLHGITFACGWGAGTINSKRVAPPELAATMQGIFQGLYFGVGQGLGALIGGLLKERYGGQAMFAMCSAIIMAAWVLVLAAELLTGSSSSGGDSSQGVFGAPDSLPAAVKPGEQQQQELGSQRIVAAGFSSLRLLWQRVRGVGGGAGVPGGVVDVPPGSRVRRHQKLYMELGSKDSGPDLGVR